MHELHQLGWDLAEDDDGELIEDGRTVDGCSVLGLWARESIIARPTLHELASASDGLARAVGLHVKS